MEQNDVGYIVFLSFLCIILLGIILYIFRIKVVGLLLVCFGIAGAVVSFCLSILKE